MIIHENLYQNAKNFTEHLFIKENIVNFAAS